MTYQPKLTPEQRTKENRIFEEQARFLSRYPDNPTVKPTGCYCVIVYKLRSQGFTGKWDQEGMIVDAYKCPIHQTVKRSAIWKIIAQESRDVAAEVNSLDLSPEEADDETIKRFDHKWDEILENAK